MTHLTSILRGCEGRYPNAEERDDLVRLAKELPQRVAAAAELESHETPIVESVIDTLSEQFPRYEKLFPQAWDRLGAELRLVLRQDAQAMLADAMPLLEDKVLFYLRSVLTAYHLPPQFTHACYSLLRDACRDAISAPAFRCLEPYLERNIAVLGVIPEPSVSVV